MLNESLEQASSGIDLEWNCKKEWHGTT